MNTAQPVVTFRVGDLDLEVHPDNQALGAAAADTAAKIINAAVERSGNANLVLATGNSQLTFLAALRRQNVAWSAVTVFHMDEYLNLPAGHPAGFPDFLRRHLLDEVRVRAFYPVPGHPADLTLACKGYEALLRAHPVDLCVLGIGENGHLAFNDPPADFGEADWVKVVDLDERSRRQQVGEGHFDRLEEVPQRAITLTISGLRSAATMLCLAPERRKAEAVRRALTGPIDGACPASILRRTPHARLLLDRDSASLLQLGSPE
jgi:glucosamine-6-phosphate deaminase